MTNTATVYFSHSSADLRLAQFAEASVAVECSLSLSAYGFKPAFPRIGPSTMLSVGSIGTMQSLFQKRGGHSDVNPTDRYGVRPRWDDVNDEEEEDNIKPRTLKEIEQEELVVVLAAAIILSAAYCIVTSSASLSTRPVSTEETSAAPPQP
ncbi:hypothetical protein CYMTET_24217 [Cymbomonas tetramitiformis]|uniref:Uncharacterized protein n=1 Tax=Cymbomonas tetramitiformis TaxID=36881 RepID=A0AAE0L0H8_9CHLO|nr:hypothetical protein CYMTET_24217 [Cymbomonas tetramitiformis]